MRRRISTPSGASNRSLRLWSDNLVLIPASQLKAIKEWQRKANQLPDGSTLLVLPAGNGRMEVVGRYICFTLYRQGRQVTVTTVH